jgi:hypothetical protein
LPKPLDNEPTAANFDGISPMDIKVERKPIQKKAVKKPGQEELFEIPSPKKLKANLGDVNPEYAQKIIAQFTQAPVTIKEKFNELRPNMAERLIQGLFDEFRSIKKYSEEAYMKSVLSKSTDGALVVLRPSGTRQWRA